MPRRWRAQLWPGADTGDPYLPHVALDRLVVDQYAFPSQLCRDVPHAIERARRAHHSADQERRSPVNWPVQSREWGAYIVVVSESWFSVLHYSKLK
jgi:hypothetical protein